MAESFALLDDLSEEAVWRLEEACCRFEQAWLSHQPPRLEDFLGGAEGAERLAVLRELLRLDVHYRRQAGEAPAAQDYAAAFPNAADLLNEMFPGASEGGGAPPPPCANDTGADAGGTGPYLGAMNSGHGDASANEEEPSGNGSCGAPPASRFQVRRFHAAGALGEVFVAEDGELHREVALKEIKRGGAGHEESRARFVLEAEITGNLEHPGIVPVYGMGAYPTAGLTTPCASSGAKPWRRRSSASTARRRCGSTPWGSGSCWAVWWLSVRRSRMPTTGACCTGTSSRTTSCWGSSARPSWWTGASPRSWAGRTPARQHRARKGR